MTGNPPILKRLYWILSAPGGRGEWPTGLLAQVLPMMNQYADIYLISQGLREDWDHMVRLLEEARAHLERWGFCRLNLRPVHPVREAQGGPLRGVYRLIFSWGSPFHREALRHQVVSRWMVLPVLRVHSESEMREALSLAQFLRERMMVPSFCLPPSPWIKGWVEAIETDRERVLLEDPEGPLASLGMHDLFDELSQWSLSSAGGFSVRPCPTLVVDTVRGTLQRCPGQGTWGYTELTEAINQGGEGEGCLACWHALPDRIREALSWNAREDEGDRVQHQLGVFALSRGDLADAGRHLGHLARRAPSKEIRGESLLYMGILHLQNGDTDAAHEALTEARRLMPHSIEAIYHLGRCEFIWRDYIAAADLFHEALDLGVPTEMDTDLRLFLGISHIHLEEFPEALEALEAAQGDVPSVLFYRAMALLGLGRIEEALDGFQRALASGPTQEDLPSVHFYIGHCLKEMDRFEEAIHPLRRALGSDPKSYEAWNLLGYCCFRLGKHQDAIEAFHRALEIKPGSAIDHANIASNLRDQGHWREAIQWYRMALRLDPTLGFAAQGLDKLERMMRET